MPSDHDAENAWRDERGWREFAASNRERIIAQEDRANVLADEIRMLRQRQHDFSEQLGAFQGLAVEVRNIADDVKALTTDVRNATSRIANAVERPTAAVVAQYAAVVVAVIALVVAAHP